MTHEERNKYQVDWYKKQSVEWKAAYRKTESAYQTAHYVSTYRNGKTVLLKGNKQPKPVDHKCELCSKVKKTLAYHHWDDKNLLKGMWICPTCHWLAEMIDTNDITLKAKYLSLKQERNT